ncbi:MAG: phytoene desaturase family protein [Candidatus Micrarchaeota archaeon]|nr:phytoene desaturase family protein [Candidatus Micrarchaeota archaeon]
MRVVIVGAGIGGLASAALLSKEHEIILIDRNDSPGGRARELKIGNYRFDRGPSWYIMHRLYSNFFSQIGNPEITLIPLKRSLRVYSNNGFIDLYPDDRKNAEIFERLERGGAEKYRRFMSRAKSLYERTMRHIYDDYRSISPSLLSLIGSNLDLLLENTDSYVNRFFSSEIARNIMKFHSVFLGDVPWKIPAFYILLIPSYLSENVMYPKGGMYRIVDALWSSIERVRFFPKATATELKIQGDVAKTLKIGGNNRVVELERGKILKDLALDRDETEIEGDVFILNNRRDVLRYIGREVRQYGDRSPIGVVLVYLGIRTDNNNLEHHNIYFSKQLDAHYRAIDRTQNIPDDFSFYFHIPSVTDKSSAPEGAHSVMLLIPVPKALEIDSRWIAERAIRKLRELIGDFEIECNMIVSPEDFQMSYLDRSSFGLSHTLFQSAMFRSKNYAENVKNLFYVGQNTNPGIGVPLVLSSAIIVKNLISELK